MNTLILHENIPDVIKHAKKEILTNNLVAIPTETVYGLAANAFNEKAILKIFQVKSRPKFDPLIVHVNGKEDLELVCDLKNYNKEELALIYKLIDSFWPGPLTIVLKKNKKIHDLVTAGLDTVAVRQSSNNIITKIIKESQVPLAAPSANQFGKISPTTANEVYAELKGKIPLIIDGGKCKYGIESTIIIPEFEKRDGRVFRILRHGPITLKELERYVEIDKTYLLKKNHELNAPGLMKSHYAPVKKIFPIEMIEKKIFKNKKLSLLCIQFDSKKYKSKNIIFETVSELSKGKDVKNNNLHEAAHNFFTKLRELDDSESEIIFYEQIPNQGIGIAINERLKKASYNSLKWLESI